MAHAWYGNWQLWTAGGGALLLLLTGVLIWAWLKVTAIQRGVTRTLRNVSDRLVRDVMLPDGIGGYVPVDALVLRGRQIYVLDIRDVEGAVFGSEKMDVWTAMGKRRRYQFSNPIRPMHDRITAVKLLAPECEAQPRILFTSRGHFPKGRPDGVQLLEEFAQPLLRAKHKGPVSIESDVQAVWARICEAGNVRDGKERPEPLKRV
jgi:hypothetical protein